MARRITRLYCNERRLFYVALSILICMFGAYMYLVSASVVNVIVRKETDQEIAQINARLSELETAYIEAKDMVNLDTALSRGFSKTPDRVFVTKKSGSLVLSRNDES